MNTVTSSRRNVMRALAALSTGLPTLAYASPGFARHPANDPVWNAALAAERAAYEASESFHAVNVAPAVLAHEAGTGSFEDVSKQEDAWGPYTSAHADALNALLLTPAPTLAAAAHKLRLGIEHWVFDGSSQSLEMVSVIADDIERLGGRA